jgi:glycosyltransferase involved in cell wall biosynthesis
MSRTIIKTSRASNPLVSVMMPVYNGEKTIDLAIKSLFLQTYNNWLCVVINDGSTDGTAEILKKYETNTRFKIIHLPQNKGRGYARQVGLENAHGDYLAFLDADDFYHPEKLERQVKAFSKHKGVDLVSCAQGSFDCDYSLQSVRGKGNGKVCKFDPIKGFTGSFAGSVIHLTKAKNHSYLTKLGAAEDKAFFWDYLEKKHYFIIPSTLYYYFEIGKTTSRKIIWYQYQTCKYEFSLIFRKPLYSIKKSLLSFSKMIGYMLILPIKGSRSVIINRGVLPSVPELESFIKTLKMINDH